VNVSDFIDFKLKQAAIALADTLSYDHAAEGLGLTGSELRDQVEALESKICLFTFTEQNGILSLTEDGGHLIRSFRNALLRRGGTVRNQLPGRRTRFHFARTRTSLSSA
jgi:DNA-binding transcriptional LysR family regulator